MRRHVGAAQESATLASGEGSQDEAGKTRTVPGVLLRRIETTMRPVTPRESMRRLMEDPGLVEELARTEDPEVLSEATRLVLRGGRHPHIEHYRRRLSEGLLANPRLSEEGAEALARAPGANEQIVHLLAQREGGSSSALLEVALNEARSTHPHHDVRAALREHAPGVLETVTAVERLGGGGETRRLCLLVLEEGPEAVEILAGIATGWHGDAEACVAAAAALGRSSKLEGSPVCAEEGTCTQ